MSANDLLLWMSAREKGSWQQFRSAVEQVQISGAEEGEGDIEADVAVGELPIYQAVRLGLERLAHVEFFGATGENEWRVVPPSLAVIKHRDEWIGIVCGARSPRLLSSLKRVRGAMYEATGQPYMPDRICLTAPTFMCLLTIAESIGLRVQKDAPIALLTVIPPVDDPRSRFVAKIPPGTGWNIQRFESSKLRWQNVELSDFPGNGTNLFRFTLRFQRYYFLYLRGQTFKVNVQVGKYILFRRRRKLIRYRASQEQLLFPLICAPPPLIERALVLCSGTLPVLEPVTHDICYHGVPENVAYFAAKLLRQEVTTL